MDGQNNAYQPGLDLPVPPRSEEVKPGGYQPENTDKQLPQKAEIASKDAELPQTGQLPPPMTPLLTNVPDEPVRSPMSQASSDPDIQAPPIDTPSVAEDNDLIEQEWVNKAKAIVERTRTDPHAQNKEINKIKADYIRKRYNKEIKVTEG